MKVGGKVVQFAVLFLWGLPPIISHAEDLKLCALQRFEQSTKAPSLALEPAPQFLVSRTSEDEDSFAAPKKEINWELYSKKLMHRLMGDDISAFLGFSPEFRVVYNPAPNAFAMNSSKVVVSSGLLDVIQTPSELAFVLAHEIGHVVLHHRDKAALFGADDADYESKLRMEMEADAFALKLLSDNGFSVTAPIRLLSRLRELRNEEGEEALLHFPSITPRLEAIEITLRSETQHAHT